MAASEKSSGVPSPKAPSQRKDSDDLVAFFQLDDTPTPTRPRENGNFFDGDPKDTPFLGDD